jgi:primosomal protein N'
MARSTSRSRRHARYAATQIEPKAGTRVRVSFGNRESTGVIVGKTITDRYNVKLEIVGTDEPVTASYTRDELGLAAG